ncbi:MAG TPA: DUF1592 domain-containing protein, partial [Myxococcaceae bacterium]|nr:DUF1592 domain-containing protein [Myxococcaceae bacterium]
SGEISSSRDGSRGDVDARSAVEVPLKRLGKIEYTNTLRDLFAVTAPQASPAVLDELAGLMSQYPDDAITGRSGDVHGGFSRLDHTVTQTHADVAYAVAVEAGRALTRTPERLKELAGACATDTDSGNDIPCVEGLVRTFGELALRRPPTADDVAFYGSAAGPAPVSPEAWADVITLLLASPDSLYHVQNGGGEVDGTTTHALTPYELASRLSYHFLQTMPDAALLADARSGALAKPEVYAAQVDRLVEDPRARGTADAFFGQWLRLKELEPLTSRLGDPVFEAFVGADRPSPNLHRLVLDEVLDLAWWVTKRGGSVAELLTNRSNFARDAELAKLYGASAWDGVGEPPVLPDPNRAGLVTRVAFLATGSANTRPIMKGLRIRSALLCDTLGPPPPEAMGAVVELSPNNTTRQTVEALTEARGTNCPACHATLLNPLGFATENFDALGRVRTHQALFDGTGQKIAEKPVDTRTVPRVDPGDDRTSNGAADMTRFLVESGRVDACLARQYFRFSFGRIEDESADAAVLEALTQSARAEGLVQLLKVVAFRPEFKQRSFHE